jgi:hypothetical protein
MVYLVIGAALILLWMWTRSAVMRQGGWRVGAGLLAVVLVIIGAVLSIRGDAIIGLPVVLLGLGAAGGARMNRSARQGPGATPPRDGMSAAEARSILGVGPQASVGEIKAAYSRLMQRAHPDKGGTAGLAAQLNAARDRLLKQ